MPSDILNADTGFPTFTDNMTSDQKIDRVTNYLFMLLEQLRYTLSNLGVDNFNDTELIDIGKIISEPILVRLEDEVSGSLTSLQITVDGIATKVQDSANNISVLQQTATTISTRLSDAENNISQVTQTANGLVTRVDNAEGSVSTLTQKVNGFETRIKNAEGNVSTLTQTVSGFSSRISNAEQDISVIEQSINGINLVVSNGKVNAAEIIAAINDDGSRINIKADWITMTGNVSFLTEEDVGDYGLTEISGSRISMTMDGSGDNGRNDITSDNGLEFVYLHSDGDREILAQIYNSAEGRDTEDSSRYALNIVARKFYNNEFDLVYPALKLAADGRISVDSQLGIYISAWADQGFITLDAADNVRIYPGRDYADVYDAPGNAYMFCTDGIYYNGRKIVNA